MDIDNLKSQVNESFVSVFSVFHTGNWITDLLAFILVVSSIVILVVLFVYFVSSQLKNSTAQLDRLDGMLGRLERLEQTLNEFRTDALRHLELSKSQLEYIRASQEHAYDLLRGEAPSTSQRVLQAPPRLRSDDFESVAELVKPETTTPPVEEIRTVQAKPEDPVKVPSPEPEKKTAVKAQSKIESVKEIIPAPSPEPEPEQQPETLAKRLKKTRSSFVQKIKSVFSSKPKLDAEAVDELEAILVGSDIGIKTAANLLSDLKEDLRFGVEVSEVGLTALLKTNLLTILNQGAQSTMIAVPRRTADGPVVVLMVGVNGAGKTTTSAKLAHQWKDLGCKVLLVAADTFRAAAVEQLIEWGRRLDVPVVSGASDAKPQTVVFDAMARAAKEPFDVVIIDTAGRLHTKQNLMDELGGIYNAVQRHQPSAPDEVLLVVDGSTGQNALMQAREFGAATKLTGLVVTKLDGTAKGGIIVAIKEELNIPVRYIGVGEGKNDLRPFVANDFVEAIFDTTENDAGTAEVSANAEIRRRRRTQT